ncbi:thioredoxin reductase [Friedmanniella endophytica]|uniref:Thioredoxin reductase n=1 Tax=Microlunatus kandeliicorticis TaxID=1759536 RepID=A0A7W3IT20_9ACTN|nr:NAD(P)/FAD-dependent oxidoreductase [Microlunatus kandeliicorticis]MBA8794737.1 thioredoxin reductase [Microlunatus kandeliicorticis]
MTEQDLATVEVAVIGGGAAGLSGALTLGRMRRSVVVIDEGRPRNAPAEGVHGYLSRDGIPPQELLRCGREEVTGYGVRILTGRVAAVAREATAFRLELGDGSVLRARRLLVTTGMTDALPEVPGVRERWGRDVLHCPFCHGWEVRDQAIGVLATTPMAAHQAQLLRLLSDDVTVFTHSTGGFDETVAGPLRARGIRLMDGRVEGLVVEADRLTGVRLADGTEVPVQALAVGPPWTLNLAGLEGLGLRTVEHPTGFGEVLEVDANGRTSVPGVWAAGTVANPTAQVSTSVAAGAWAGATIVASLLEDTIEQAVEEARLVAGSAA